MTGMAGKPLPKSAFPARFSGDGKTLFLAPPGWVGRFDLTEPVGNPPRAIRVWTHRIAHPGRILPARNGRHVVAANTLGTVVCLDVETGEPRWETRRLGRMSK